jgi:hypothetical protein
MVSTDVDLRPLGGATDAPAVANAPRLDVDSIRSAVHLVDALDPSLPRDDWRSS